MAYVNDVHICDNCQAVSDDGLVTVCVEPGDAGDRNQPRYDAVVEDWCQACVDTKTYHAVVRDDDDAARESWEADAYDRDAA